MKGGIFTELDARLKLVASFVRDGAFLIDVGTDHAYIPIALISSGRISRAVASDINDGPCLRAEKNVRESGFGDRIDVMRHDGIPNIAIPPYTDIVIAGMGGTLISEIVERADFIKRSDVHLILQPMRNMPELRRYLYENGFCIYAQGIARDGERIYETDCAFFDGQRRSYTDVSLLLGEKNMEKKKATGELFLSLCERKASSLRKKISGMSESGKDYSKESALLSLVLAQKDGV